MCGVRDLEMSAQCLSTISIVAKIANALIEDPRFEEEQVTQHFARAKLGTGVTRCLFSTDALDAADNLSTGAREPGHWPGFSVPN